MTRHLFRTRGLAISVLLAILFVATNLAADVRSTYWGEVDTSNQATLQQTVHDTIRNHILVPYTTVNWPILEAADVDPSNPGHILDIYKNESYEITSGSRPYNREHVWPQSRGFPQGGTWSLHPRADMHNLFLCDVGYNSSRSNNYFGNCHDGCDERPTEFNNGVGGGTGVFPGNSNWRTSTTWQVWDDRKGDAARAVMYMAARYNGGNNIDGTPEPDLRLTDDINLLQTGAQPVAYMALQSALLQWHQEDLPDSKEIFRHEVIYGAQQNRNPFIDFPEWGDCFFLGDCSSVAPMTPQNVIASNDGDDVTLTWSPRIETDLDGYHVYRSSTSGSGFARLTTDPISTTSFLDDTINPMDLYYYVVTAIDTMGNESIFSSEVTSQDFVGVAIAIPTNPDTPYIQNFNSMGTLVAATLPEHFLVAKSVANAQTGQIIWEDGVTVTDFRGGNSLSSSAANGIYNFGAGDPSTATDRAIGFLSSG
ncbi:MAG: endonuclease, partial [Candidatus Sumerlaeia bacterium]|nr:endonuclease [Candidatus Sumerlaeia bacterium]